MVVKNIEKQEDLSFEELRELIDNVIEWEKQQKKVEDVAFPILGGIK